jgi:hypothetical protein
MARPCTPSRGTSSTKDRAEGGAGARTPGSAVRRTGLSGTPRRVKSPFPRAPGLRYASSSRAFLLFCRPLSTLVIVRNAAPRQVACAPRTFDQVCLCSKSPSHV